MSERKPLTLEELRKMDGKPAYWLDDDSYGIISVESYGRWAYVPFFRGRKNGVNFEYNIKSRRIEVYAVEPPRLDRSAWKPCKYCGKGRKDFGLDGCGDGIGIVIGESVATIESDSWGFLVNFCPKCGRPLTEEAWAMLEKRLEV